MIKCDYCNNTFKMNVKTKKVDDLEVTYFICPHCNHEYASMVTDAKLRKMIQHVKNLAVKVQKNVGKTKHDRCLQEYLKAKEECELYSKEASLKERVEYHGAN